MPCGGFVLIAGLRCGRHTCSAIELRGWLGGHVPSRILGVAGILGRTCQVLSAFPRGPFAALQRRKQIGAAYVCTQSRRYFVWERHGICSEPAPSEGDEIVFGFGLVSNGYGSLT